MICLRGLQWDGSPTGDFDGNVPPAGDFDGNVPPAGDFDGNVPPAGDFDGNVPPAAHFSHQLEKWAKEPFETDGFKTSFALKSCVRYGL